MNKKYGCRKFLLGLLLCSVQFEAAYGAECRITLPETSPIDGAPLSPKMWGYYGSEMLAALIPVDGKWVGQGADLNYGDKFWWWKKGFVPGDESALTISGTRLDATAPQLEPMAITSGTTKHGSLMLVGMKFPTSGCWQVVGKYEGQELTIVLQVGE